jgi:hypothetical protein
VNVLKIEDVDSVVVMRTDYMLAKTSYLYLEECGVL